MNLLLRSSLDEGLLDLIRTPRNFYFSSLRQKMLEVHPQLCQEYPPLAVKWNTKFKRNIENTALYIALPTLLAAT